MAKVVFYKITNDQLSSVTKKEGQLIFVTDKKRLYLDNSSSSRLEIASYSLTQDANDGHKLTFTNPDGTTATITIPDNNTTYTGSNGITLTGTNFTNSGVRSISTGSSNGTISVDTNGTAAEVSVAGLAAMAYKSVVAASDITSGTIGVVRGGTGTSTLASGEVLVGNGTDAITTKAIDTASGGTASSTSLITSGAVNAGLGTKLNTTLKGANGGLAELDANGKVPSSQLPSYVDDVLEYSSQSGFPATGETGKIYVATDTNKTYRWSGSGYVAISSDLALGETSSTAYRGDRGAAAYTHAVTNKGSAFANGLYKITTNSEGHVTTATTVAKSDITALGIPEDNNTFYAVYGTTSYADVLAAFNAKKFIYVYRDNEICYQFNRYNASNGSFYFKSFSSSTNTLYGATLASDGTWSPNSYALALLSSPTFTGTPKAPTAAAGTNTTQIATTEFVQTAIEGAAPGSSVSFTRNLTSGTQVGTLTIDGTDTVLYAPTNTDNNVTQTYTTTSANYPLLFKYSSGTSSTTNSTEYARFGNKIYVNPSTGALYATSLYRNGTALGGASIKAVDTSISASSSSANLPTSAAVATFVEGKGYITSSPSSLAVNSTITKNSQNVPAVFIQSSTPTATQTGDIWFIT